MRSKRLWVMPMTQRYRDENGFGPPEVIAKTVAPLWVERHSWLVWGSQNALFREGDVRRMRLSVRQQAQTALFREVPTPDCAFP